MSRVVLAMSGGVDSSVAAWLLREQGHDVVGLFMRHGQEQLPSPLAPLPKGEGTHSPAPLSKGEGTHCPGPLPKGEGTHCPAPLPKGEGTHCPAPLPKGEGSCSKQGCCTATDAADARRVADVLEIPFYAVNFKQEFARIVDYFVREYTTGRTPNPCIVCNTWLKFGRLFDYADSVGAEYVATGHYARIIRLPDGRPALCRGLDHSKDQSYVLFGIPRRLLGRLMFPVGEYRKPEIRRIAERLGLRVAAKRDSQEICFVPDQDHARFIRQRCGQLDTAGEIVTTDGTVVGRHDGFERFTVGQRKGLRLAFGQPRYVVRIEADRRRVVIGTREELARTELYAAEANWLTQGREERGEGRGKGKSEIRNPKSEMSDSLSAFRAEVKIRYRSPTAAATVEPLDGSRFRVRFDEPCYGVAPGQAAVCYDGDRVLGGGWIE